MLAGLNETQKNEICEFIDGMPILPNVIRDAVICGNGYWYPIGENVPEVKAVAYYLDQIYKENRIGAEMKRSFLYNSNIGARQKVGERKDTSM